MKKYTAVINDDHQCFYAIDDSQELEIDSVLDRLRVYVHELKVPSQEKRALFAQLKPEYIAIYDEHDQLVWPEPSEEVMEEAVEESPPANNSLEELLQDHSALIQQREALDLQLAAVADQIAAQADLVRKQLVLREAALRAEEERIARDRQLLESLSRR